MDLANTLKMLRKNAKLTQEDLAQKTGLSFHAINSYESGRRTPNSKAMAILESFFHVSGEYLRGESDSRFPESQWDDPEIMEAVRESFPIQLSTLNDILKDCSAQEQKLAFDILGELSHVLKLGSPEYRTIAISLLQNAFWASTHYVDVCMNAVKDDDPAPRIERAKQVAVSQYSQALEETVAFLPNRLPT